MQSTHSKGIDGAEELLALGGLSLGDNQWRDGASRPGRISGQIGCLIRAAGQKAGGQNKQLSASNVHGWQSKKMAQALLREGESSTAKE